MDVPDAKLYGTHDFRRGHAEDLRQCGASLAEILLAGQWKSAAFLKYLDEAELEKACRCALGLRCVRSGLLVRTSCLKPLSRVMRSCSLIDPIFGASVSVPIECINWIAHFSCVRLFDRQWVASARILHRLVLSTVGLSHRCISFWRGGRAHPSLPVRPTGKCSDGTCHSFTSSFLARARMPFHTLC